VVAFWEQGIWAPKDPILPRTLSQMGKKKKGEGRGEQKTIGRRNTRAAPSIKRFIG